MNLRPMNRPAHEQLLAVDLGLRCGLACYQLDGQLLWYRSHNFGKRSRLKRAIEGLLKQHPLVAQLVLEGGDNFAKYWQSAAARRGLAVRQLYAETWRPSLLRARERTHGRDAKQAAIAMASQIIAECRGPKPTQAPRHDAAEAILIGYYFLQHELDC